MTQGFAADPVYVKGEVFAYVGLPQNLKDLKDDGRHTPPSRRMALEPVSLCRYRAPPVWGFHPTWGY